MFKNRLKFAGTIVLTCLCLCACGDNAEEKELAVFSEAMTSFTLSIKSADEDINTIDVNNDSATSDLLLILDQLQVDFESLAELSVPDQFESIEELADDASEYMKNAVSYFHSAYEGETFNEQDADIAYQYYTRAMKRIEIIGFALTGDIPENENITVYEETNDSKLIDKLLQRSDEEIATGEIIE